MILSLLSGFYLYMRTIYTFTHLLVSAIAAIMPHNLVRAEPVAKQKGGNSRLTRTRQFFHVCTFLSRVLKTYYEKKLSGDSSFGGMAGGKRHTRNDYFYGFDSFVICIYLDDTTISLVAKISLALGII